MNHSTRPQLCSLSLLVSIVTLGMLSACSVQPTDTETLGQGDDSRALNLTDDNFVDTASRNKGA